ncbi:hypothetical protein SCHPADRAFT_712259 [Schizopora paradoxa]|uniref:Uncharacterized protein n=1 Tax=Schizopora paradoxa TaxID=27342 RepID=A0A0H2R208_9AGAM|nr:hypothetical protein SCHPADRAFT_721167 [Schizopora paradoxa]KLO05790.1 hypothetical protein SCHPADRAFT_712259 [Schizopora paradoxa]
MDDIATLNRRDNETFPRTFTAEHKAWLKMFHRVYIGLPRERNNRMRKEWRYHIQDEFCEVFSDSLIGNSTKITKSKLDCYFRNVRH